MEGFPENDPNLQRIHTYWKEGTHKNLIRVYQWHHRLRNPHGDYAIDMEFCDFNLEDYLTIEELRKTGDSSKLNRDSSRLRIHCPCPTKEIHFIMSHLTEGIKFLHENKIAYMKLKPKNGIHLPKKY